MTSYKDISLNVTTDSSFQLTKNNSIYSYNTNQISFYNNINSLITKNPLYTDTLETIKWNTYYYKKYKAENLLLYFIIIACILIIVINILKNKYTFLDDISYSVIMGIILAYSAIHIFYNLWNIIYKDNLNFDENDYMFNNMYKNGSPSSSNPNSNADSDTGGSCSKTTVTPSNVSEEDIDNYLMNL